MYYLFKKDIGRDDLNVCVGRFCIFCARYSNRVRSPGCNVCFQRNDAFPVDGWAKGIEVVQHYSGGWWFPAAAAVTAAAGSCDVHDAAVRASFVDQVHVVSCACQRERGRAPFGVAVVQSTAGL